MLAVVGGWWFTGCPGGPSLLPVVVVRKRRTRHVEQVDQAGNGRIEIILATTRQHESHLICKPTLEVRSVESVSPQTNSNSSLGIFYLPFSGLSTVSDVARQLNTSVQRGNAPENSQRRTA